MTAVFMYAFNAVMPIIALTFLGYFLKHIKMFDKSFLDQANKLVFQVFLPVLLYVNIYSIQDFSDIPWPVIWYALGIGFAVFIIGCVFSALMPTAANRKGVLVQCFLRSNFAIIGIPLADALGGKTALAVVSLLSAFTIPLFNILTVIGLTIFISDEEMSAPGVSKGRRTAALLKDVLIKIVKNPLIIAVVLGLITIGVRSLLPRGADGKAVFTIQKSVPFIYTFLKYISSVATPLALIALGGSFTFSAAKGMLKEIAAGTIGRLIMVPLFGLGGAVILGKMYPQLGFDSSVYPALVALFASPVAATSAIMSRQMKNDGELAGQLVFWTSFLSMFTIYVTVVILRSMQLL